MYLLFFSPRKIIIIYNFFHSPINKNVIKNILLGEKYSINSTYTLSFTHGRLKYGRQSKCMNVQYTSLHQYMVVVWEGLPAGNSFLFFNCVTIKSVIYVPHNMLGFTRYISIYYYIIYLHATRAVVFLLGENSIVFRQPLIYYVCFFPPAIIVLLFYIFVVFSPSLALHNNI